MSLGDLDEEALLRAVQAHLRDPERGRWWPSPADLLAHAVTPTRQLADDDAACWDTILARMGRGEYSIRTVCDEVQYAAIEAVGGTWALRRAEGGAGLGALRKRYLAACRDRRERPAMPALLAPRANPRLGGFHRIGES